MKLRLATAAILVVIVLGVVLLANNVTFFALSSILVGLGISEFRRLEGSRSWPALGGATLLGLSACVCLYGQIAWVTIASFCLSLLAVVILLNSGIGSWLRAECASLWVGAPFISIMALHEINRPHASLWHFPNLTIMLLLPLWSGDIFALLIGKRFGKHLLAPAVSPGKTYEGAAANMVATILMSILVGSWLRLPVTEQVVWGVSTSVFGQLGDLFESSLKRRVGAKDSSSLLPGHGGFLDRMDSLFFAAIPSALIAVYWPWP